MKVDRLAMNFRYRPYVWAASCGRTLNWRLRAGLAVAAGAYLPGWGAMESMAGELAFAPPSFILPGHGVIAVEAPDLDGDGDCDLLIASISSTVSLVRNLGQGQMGGAEPYAIGATHLDMVVADFNADGDLDVALANFGTGSVSVALNIGKGIFDAPRTFPTPGLAFARGLAAGDLDLDGDQDLMVGDGVSANKVILLNDGCGSFDQSLAFAAGGSTIAIAVGDLDNDSDLDAVSVFSGSFVHVNNGNATFAPAIDLNAAGATAVAIVDLNDDGLNDIVAARSTGGVNQAVIFLNDGASPPFPHVAYTIDSLVRDIAVGDLDADGDVDIATSHVSPEDSVNILLNDGDGIFAKAVSWPVGVYPQSLAIADFDEDGRNDIATANQFADPPSIGLLINQTPLPVAGDITGDGAVDVNDMLAVINAWGACFNPDDCPEDVAPPGPPAGDDLVNVLDLLFVISNWS